MRINEVIVSELNVNQTLKFIQQAHGDQLYGKLPYWHHPRAVAMTGKKIFGSSFNSDAVKAAFLHDVVEDTHISLDELKKLDFSDEVIEAVGLLTKDKKLSYSDNIKKIIGSGNKLAQMVKYADNYENFSGDKSDWDPKRADASQKKYLASLNMLGDHLGVKYHISIDEGWKDWVAGAALGAAALGASPDAEAGKLKNQHHAKPSAVHQIKQPVKKIDPLKAISKKEIDKSVTGNPHEVLLKKAAEKAGIQGQELAAFLSQCAHETMDFKHLKEIGGSLDFKKYDPRFAPNKAKALGNTKPGDGAKYKGRGYIHLTGKYNYGAASKAIYGDDRLVKDPSLVEKPEVAAKTAVWFWQNRVQDKVKNFTNVKDVTKGINPGLKHLDQRSDKFKSFQVAMR